MSGLSCLVLLASLTAGLAGYFSVVVTLVVTTGSAGSEPESTAHVLRLASFIQSGVALPGSPSAPVAFGW